MSAIPRIFLSASVPLPTRNEAYFRTADVIAIRDAVKALTIVVAEEPCELVFGGHPAIMPMIRLQLAQLGLSVGKHVTVFVSAFFKSDFPADLAAFERVIITEAVNKDRAESLAAMRHRMLEGQFRCGIFLGGMEGVEDEFKLFSDLHPRTPVYPVASTGAAAAIIYDENRSIRDANPALLEELSYLHLMRGLISRGANQILRRE